MVAQYLATNDSTGAHMTVGHLFMRLKMWPDAAHYYEIVTKRKDRHAKAWYLLGLAYHQQKKINEAIEALQKSLGISSKTRRTYDALGEALELNRTRHEARTVYENAIKKTGQAAKYYRRLCWLNFQDFFVKKAASSCRQAVARNPKDVQSQTLLAYTLYEQGKRKEALAKLSSAIKKYPQKSLPHHGRGLIYFKEKSYEAAVRDLGKAFGLDPMNDEAGIYLARAYFEIQQYDLALQIFIDTIRLNRSFRYELMTKQRELMRLNKNGIANKYMAAIDLI